MKILHIVAAGVIATLTACATKPAALAEGPDCRPMVAYVVLQCWYGGRDAGLSQCQSLRESPPGCGIDTDAVAFFNSGIDLSPIYAPPGSEDRPRWAQFNVYRDAEGRVGRKYSQDRGGVITERLYEEDRIPARE
ncbi:hypothetical protein [Brevundimonas sp.]|uniref:hypothetical protein n=1 Tax=Brevundimonas sp. TaxID=1871086 RepID=UPI002D22EC73|nr:hypothetical protein [Brevundimonas sp.]HYC75045.1 hypothetical protein [Brevundimonas sp.]